MSTCPTQPVTLFFSSPLEPEHVERVRQVSPRLRLLVPTDLWPKLRYVADHAGEPIAWTPEQEKVWLEQLAQAEVCFDFDRWHLADMVRLAPRLRWVQSTSAGIIHYMEQSRLGEAGVVVTTASGIHAVPLAEWVVSAVLWHEKRHPHLAALKDRKHWERFCGGEAHGKTACILGYGQVGRKVGEYLRGIGISVYGIASGGLVATPDGMATPAKSQSVSEALDEVLPRVDYLVAALPGTTATNRLLDGRRLSMLPAGALVVNVGRGNSIDETALVGLLASGHLGGAALDVFETEPLPASSPLWDMPNVLINPHSASTSFRENGRITDIFCDNLRRYLAGEPLVNVYRPERGY
jgi:glyoxylate/hydroxypyruvate reductase